MPAVMLDTHSPHLILLGVILFFLSIQSDRKQVWRDVCIFLSDCQMEVEPSMSRSLCLFASL